MILLWALLGGLLAFFFVVLLAVGVAWAPFAAVVSFFAARSQGLPPFRYAGIGALYSALSFFLWLYWVLRLFNKKIPSSAIVIVYTVLYTLWLGPIIVLFAFIFAATYPDTPGFVNSEPEISIAVVVVSCSMVLLAFVTSLLLILPSSNFSPRDNTDGLRVSPRYLISFALMHISMAGFLLLYVAPNI